MNKRMRELLAKIEAKKEIAKSFMDGETKDIEKANATLDEVAALQKEYETEKRLYEMTKDSSDETTIKPVEPTANKVDPLKSFADAARNGFRVNKSANESNDGQGGYIVPNVISTKINELKVAKASLLDLVRVSKVSTNKGSNTFKARANQTGFSLITEGGKVTSKATPTFTRISYEIKKYGGYFPVTNELLNDTDANLVDTLQGWIADESRVTANQLIMAAIATKTAVELDGLDAIKKAFNVTLGSAFKSASCIVTNDDGLNYLDTLKDADGKYLLSPDPLTPMAMKLAIGASFVPVKVYPNDDLKNVDSYAITADTAINKKKAYYTKSGDVYTKVASPVSSGLSTYYEHTIKYPFVLGDLYEGVEFFDRQQLSIKQSDTAQVGELNAFEEDLTLFRAIEREDVKVRDSSAFVNGYIAVVE